MMDKFDALSAREKILVCVMAVLILLFILLQLIILPLTRFHNQSEQVHLKAQKDRIFVEQNISRLSADPNGGAQNRQAFSRVNLINTARTAGIDQLNRIQPQPNGDLKLWLDDVPAPALISFLQNVERQYITSVTGAQITRSEGDLVSAQISFAMPDETPNGQ